MCRSTSILPLLSKTIKRIIYNQLSKFLEKYLNSSLIGFRKCNSTQMLCLGFCSHNKVSCLNQILLELHWWTCRKILISYCMTFSWVFLACDFDQRHFVICQHRKFKYKFDAVHPPPPNSIHLDPLHSAPPSLIQLHPPPPSSF